MLEALQVGMLLPGAVGVCCTMADRRARSLPGWLPSIVMALAMADMALDPGSPVVAPIGWVALLMFAAVVPVLRLRLDFARRTPLAAAMALHRSLTLLLTAATIGAMGAGPVRSAGTIPAPGHAGMTVANPLLVLSLVGLVGVTGLTLWLVARLSRRPHRDRIAIVEMVSMLGGVLSMAGAVM